MFGSSHLTESLSKISNQNDFVYFLSHFLIGNINQCSKLVNICIFRLENRFYGKSASLLPLYRPNSPIFLPTKL